MKQQSNGDDKIQALPACLIREAGGIFVDMSVFPVGGGFEKAIDKLFGDGARFAGLDYRLLTELLYEFDDVIAQYGMSAKLRLAGDVVAFSPGRKALYKAVKKDADNSSAEYLFEPVSIKVVVEEPVYGEPDAEGVAPVVGMTRSEVLKPTRLEVDEFVADMWSKGIRYGVDVKVVAEAIKSGGAARMIIANQREETEGQDAEIEEASSVLHRDNSPKALVNGKVDLRRFQNRFPQIAKGDRLLKKKASVPGRMGHKVDGEPILPESPIDEVDLFAMAGPGTHVAVQDGCEYIIASHDGFLSLDIKSNHISVTDTIENKGGISLRTTGDLVLTGNDFIEHGEVQEGRVVEGKNMTFRSDVYGDVVSNGGFILLEGNLSGGSAKVIGGDVTSNGRAFNSVIDARSGQITLQYAESCLVMGKSVVIERAVNCDIVAQSVQIGSAEGCGIAGRNIQISSSSACRAKETLVSMAQPDLSALDEKINQINKAIDDCNKAVEVKDQQMAQLKSDAEFAKFLAMAASIRQGKIQLNAAQQEGWQKMTAKFAKPMSLGGRFNTEKQELASRVQAFGHEKSHLLDERAKTCTGIRCEIEQIEGDTMVQSMIVDIEAFQARNVKEIRLRLREHGVEGRRIFTDDTGSFSWKYEAVAPVENA